MGGSQKRRKSGESGRKHRVFLGFGEGGGEEGRKGGEGRERRRKEGKKGGEGEERGRKEGKGK